MSTVTAPASTPVPLTSKGLIAFLVLVLYVGVSATYILAERRVLAERLGEMDRLHLVEEAFKRSALAMSNAMLSLRLRTYGGEAASAAREELPYALEVVEQSFRDLQAQYPAVLALNAAAQRRVAALGAGTGAADLMELREAVAALAREVDRESIRAREERRTMGRDYRERYDRVAIMALALGTAGLLAFGGAAALFFSRLATDLGRLERRAGEIVAGQRGEPLEVTRRDEVGSLTRAVNRMAKDLEDREREAAVARERRAHREKMVALGTMANRVAHEIGNPLSTIAALAEYAGNQPAGEACRECRPDLILKETRRIADMTRQIADFAVPGDAAPEPVDLAAMLGALSGFLEFDPQFSATRVELRLPPRLPLLVVVPGQLSEVLMNLLLLSLGADGAPRPERITVEAEAVGAGLTLRVSGSTAPGDGARLERTRRLVEGMGGRMHDAAPAAGGWGIELPAYEAAARA
jgi:C4-dicarboxylate-specific signal transduction histidine kinase